jgi:dTDP-glucose pyrophosphorylase
MINVIVPMCGVSQRFTDADYTVPKFVLDVKGKPMYASAVNSLKLTVEHQLYFVVDALVSAEYNLKNVIKRHFPDAKVIELIKNTKGFAETVMKTRQHVDINNGTLIVCCDQLIEYDSVAYNKMLENPHIAGSLLTFTDCAADPKWTYARVDLIDQITTVACKQPISSTPIVGIYHYADSIEMYRAIKNILDKDIRTNGEYYVCDAVARSVQTSNKPWKAFQVDRMIALGTPEDYETYTNNNI